MDPHDFDDLTIVPKTFREGMYLDGTEAWRDDRRMDPDRRADSIQADEYARLRNTLRRKMDRDMDTFIDEFGGASANE